MDSTRLAQSHAQTPPKDPLKKQKIQSLTKQQSRLTAVARTLGKREDGLLYPMVGRDLVFWFAFCIRVVILVPHAARRLDLDRCNFAESEFSGSIARSSNPDIVLGRATTAFVG